MRRFLCLNLVTNAVVTWNTVYIAAAIEQLRTEGVEIADEVVAHIPPCLYGHINPYGRYRFDVDRIRPPVRLTEEG